MRLIVEKPAGHLLLVADRVGVRCIGNVAGVLIGG